MKSLHIVAMPIIAGIVMAFSTFADPLPIGSAIPNPETKMKDISGADVSFKDAMRKNGLLVMFTCNTCPVVAKYRSRTLELTKFAMDNGLGVILINSNEATRDEGDSFDDMKEYAKEQGFTFNYVLDKQSSMADAFGASRTPEIYLFGKDAKLAYSGAIDDNANGGDGVSRHYAKDAIGNLVAGGDITTKQTRSVGCAIKRLN